MTEAEILKLKKELKEELKEEIFKEILFIIEERNKESQVTITYPTSKARAREKTVGDVLDHNNIRYEKEKTVDGLGAQRFDYYLPEFNAMIEFDGLQHFKPVNYFGGEDALAERKIRDEEKNTWCERNNVPLLRLRYDQTVDDVVNNLNTFLKRLKFYPEIVDVLNREIYNILENDSNKSESMQNDLSSVMYVNHVGIDNIINKNINNVWHEYRLWCYDENLKTQSKNNFIYDIKIKCNLDVFKNKIYISDQDFELKQSKHMSIYVSQLNVDDLFLNSVTFVRQNYLNWCNKNNFNPLGIVSFNAYISNHFNAVRTSRKAKFVKNLSKNKQSDPYKSVNCWVSK